MICFNCGIKLHTGEEKECQICGVKFAIKCPACEFPNPAMAKFCINCGTRLARTDMQSSVRNFDTLTENRKNVAVIFADVSGFTALSEKMDPEEVREIINECFSYITKPVYEMEGTIDKYIGDCVMILFGAKYTHSDDAKRALICAAKMMSFVKDFSEERLSSRGFSLNLSIGVNYGLVVTGSVGNYFDKDYTVMGDIVNTAQRLQSAAGKGTILVSESVYMETRDVVSYSEPREVSVKNKENPVRCYSPLDLNIQYSFEREIPFIGREIEIDRLNAIYNSTLNTGIRGIGVIGEAGIGKTRLLKEFVSKLGSDIKRVWVDCSAISQNRVYFVISGILTGIMNINPGDSASVKQHRLMSFLDYILADFSDEEKKRNYDFLGLVLGLGRDNEFQDILNSMGFDNIKREILKQLTIFFVNLCKKHRLVAVVDDIHWGDSGSMYMLKELIASLPAIGATFILSSRYEAEEFNPTEKNGYQRIRLGPLDEAGVESLACKLLNCNEIDRALLDAIIRFTNGNALYVKEFVSNIKRTGRYRIVDGTALAEMNEITDLPNNIQGLILANLSELDDKTKSFLQAASVVGKEFELSLVCRLLDWDMDEGGILRLPMQMNIISFKSVHTFAGNVEKFFVFNQDMEREVIYDSILNKAKRELHKKIGELIESKYTREIEGCYEILYTHFHKAGVDKKAGEYCYRTALKYKKDFSFNSALEYFHKFLEFSDGKSEAEKDPRIVRTYTDIGYINFIIADYDSALAYLDMALCTASLSDDTYSVKIMIADVYKEQGRYEDALKIFDEIEPKIKPENSIYGKLLQLKCKILRITGSSGALSLAKKSEKILLRTKDYQNLSETMNQAGIIYFIKGDINHSLFYLNKSYKYAEQINNLEVMAKVSGNLGIIYHSTGMVSKALESFNKSLDISKKISDLQGYITGCINLGVLYMEKGLFDKADGLFGESLGTAREISSRLYECESLTNFGDLMFERGQYDKALSFYNQSLEVARDINVPIEEGVVCISFARLYLKLGKFEEVPGLLERACGIFDEAGEVMYLSDYYVYKSLFEVKDNNMNTALEYCEKAVNIAVECKNDAKKLKALRLKGNILRHMGQWNKAAQMYDEAIMLAEQVESDYEAAQGYYERCVVFTHLNKFKEAEMDLAKAREYIRRVDRCSWTSVIEGE